LLLDVHDLDVNPKNHGFDSWARLRPISLQRIVEIHGAARGPWSENLIDSRGAPFHQASCIEHPHSASTSSDSQLLAATHSREGATAAATSILHRAPPFGIHQF